MSSLITLLFVSPVTVPAFVVGWLYGTAKNAFLHGYAASSSGVAERLQAQQLEKTIMGVLAMAKQGEREEGSKLQ